MPSRPSPGPEAVLAYLSRYTHRVAISNGRLIAFDESGVTFRYKDYRRDGADRQQVMTLATDEFIRRFLLHVLPRGFHRIRHYGLLAGAARKASLALGPPAARRSRLPPWTIHLREPDDFRPPCPCCGGRMIVIEVLRTVEAAARTAGRNGNEPGECPMTRHGQVTAPRPRHPGAGQREDVRASLWRRPSGRRSLSVSPRQAPRPSPNATSSTRPQHDMCAFATGAGTPGNTNPHSSQMRPAGSCMGGFRTPDGTRNPSPCTKCARSRQALAHPATQISIAHSVPARGFLLGRLSLRLTAPETLDEGHCDLYPGHPKSGHHSAIEDIPR